MSKVQLYVYDLSGGLAKQFGPMFGLDIDGVWHSAVVVHGKEIYFGQGIKVTDAGKTHLGQAQRVYDLGETEVPWELVDEYISTNLAEEYAAERYHLLDHNCNHFSEELAQFLTGQSIPAYIGETAQKAARTPLGQMLATRLAQGGGAAVQ